MKTTTRITVEHVVIQSSRSYEEVKTALEERMGMLGNTDELGRQLAAMKAPWEEITKAIEQRLGSSGFTIFSKVEQGQILSLARKPRRKVVQYAVGNPLLAIQMIEHVPEVALYAPLRLTVYEGDRKTFVAYDRFTSLLAQYQHPEVAKVARVVEQTLEALVAGVTGTEARVQVPA